MVDFRCTSKDGLAGEHALGGRVDVVREPQRRVRNALEAGEAVDVDDVRSAVAEDEVQAE